MKFRKKPVEIEAMLYDGTLATCAPVHKWLGYEHTYFDNEGDACDAGIEIETLEGVMLANPGDWIIKGVQGEFYPCREDIFRQTYEAVEGES